MSLIGAQIGAQMGPQPQRPRADFMYKALELGSSKSPLGREVAKEILCRGLGLWEEGKMGCSAGRGSYVPETQDA